MAEENRQNRSGSPQRRRRSNRNRNNNQGRRNPRKPRKPAPLKMTFWMKVKKFFGCFDEEAERKKQNAARRKQTETNTNNTKPAAKSNTRNAKASTGNQTARNSQPAEVTTPRLYLGNLSYEVTEYELEDLFKGVGSVRNVEIIYNRQTHKSKGYGFVQMLNVEEAKRAVEVLHDQPFMGRNLVVSGAKGARRDGNDTDAA